MAAPTSSVVLVTGASSGIGEATVRRLVRAGWRVAFTARREERLQALAREIDPGGFSTLPLAGDVTDAIDRERWIAAVIGRCGGRLDALVNNAGFGQRGPVEIVPVEDVRRNFETNLFSLIALTQLALPIMRAQGRGRVVNIGSIAGRIARPYSSVYDATKHALNAISDGLRNEVRRFGIDVVVIEPGAIRSEFAETAEQTLDASVPESGAYADVRAVLQKGRTRTRSMAAPADDMARLVEKALTARRPRPRYAGPLHAKIFLLVRRLLPDRVFDRLLGG